VPRAAGDAAVRAHLSEADPVLAALLARHDVLLVEDDDTEREHYAALVRSIVGQQLSTHVARIMWERLLERYGGRPPTPEEVLNEDPEELRAAIGLSRAKVSFLRSLAEKVTSGELDLEAVARMDDEEAIAALTEVRGIGEWSAHMFLMFQLRRPDVLAWGDLAIRRGVQDAYGLPELPDRERLEKIAERWRPHRTAACRVIWWSLDGRSEEGAG
jgi:DNA-3-methyladenine glycosylase II